MRICYDCFAKKKNNHRNKSYCSAVTKSECWTLTSLLLSFAATIHQHSDTFRLDCFNLHDFGRGRQINKRPLSAFSMYEYVFNSYNNKLGTMKYSRHATYGFVAMLCLRRFSTSRTETVLWDIIFICAKIYKILQSFFFRHSVLVGFDFPIESFYSKKNGMGKDYFIR